MGTITRGLANSITTGGKVVSTSLSGTIQASNVNNESLDSVTAFDSSLGDFVETTASDVTASPTTKGQLFYNTTDGVLKGVRLQAAAWSSGGNLNTARGGTNNAAGDKTAGVTFGGQVPPGRSDATEEYDGTSWTSVTNTPAARRSYLVTGTQTASLLCGGQPPTPTANGDAETYEYNGSSFTETSDINNQRDSAAGAGTQTAGLAIGGRTRPGSTFVPNANVEEYDGSTWTTANAMPANNSNSTGATGPQTAAVFATAKPAHVASYDGTNWTAITATQQIPDSYGGTGVAGTSSSDVYMGGGEEPGGTRHGVVQKYDGTSWTTQPSFSVARNSFGYTGTSPAQLICGGQGDPGYVASTEEFTVATDSVKTITTS